MPYLWIRHISLLFSAIKRESRRVTPSKALDKHKNLWYNINMKGGEHMTYGELKRLLRKSGCYPLKTRGRQPHEKWYSPMTGKKFPVGRHDSEEVKIKTLNSILTDAGLKPK